MKIYGDPEMALHAPIISLNIGDEDSARIADILWEDYSICVRAGAHCAPLMHKALGTVEQGVVRFSFSHFNTEAEVLQTAAAVQELAQEIDMRIKKTYIVLSFRTTLDAMEWEKQCLAEKVPGRLIPLPREISAGCGLAWRMLPEEFEQWQNRLDPVRYDQAAAVEQ